MNTSVKRKIAVIAAALVVFVGATAESCDDTSGTNNASKDAQKQGQQQTVDAFNKQEKAEPYPATKLTDSLERKNLIEKALRYNNPSKISYIYLLSNTGGIYAYFTIKGKVSSNSSQLTTSQFLIYDQGGSGGGNSVVDAPGDDGSYGPDEPGIFFFTTSNVMVTWDGPYLLLDAPMKVNAAGVTLTLPDGSVPSSTGK
jgi:hypothetical protein